LYRVDRMLQQLALSGGLSRVRAIVLGTFHQCEDGVPSVLKKAPSKPGSKASERMLRSPKPSELKPLRARMKAERALTEIFRWVSERYGIPVATGLQVGHGNGYLPLPLGARYRLSADGCLELLGWNWLKD